jgi:hypothetical protein
MVAFNDVQAQLVSLKEKAGFLGVQEVKKIAYLLESDEKILLCKKGWLHKKSTILCITDKKVAYIDVRSQDYVIGIIYFEHITSILRSAGRLSHTVRIHTTDSVLTFVVWRKRHAQDLHTVIGRHWQYINDITNSSRIVSRPLATVRDLQTWRSLVRRVGTTSVNH